MFDITKIPTVERAFKDYSLVLSGNANFLTVTCDVMPKAKLFAVSNTIPLNETVQFVCRLFPNAAITACATTDPEKLYIKKWQIMHAVQLMAKRYYFVFPLVHNLYRRGGCYSLPYSFEKMPIRLKRQFSVCAFIETGRVQFPGMPHVPEDLTLYTGGISDYIDRADDYTDQCLNNELENLENECKLLNRTA